MPILLGNKTLFIVSNRLPVTVSSDAKGVRFRLSSGGLVSGLKEIHKSSRSKWIGHCGIFENDPNFKILEQELVHNDLYPVAMSKRDYRGYYNGMSNGAIWPLFHYFSTAMKFSFDDWQRYEKVNRLFADKILELANDGDYIWVQDYQLMLVPKYLRDSGRKFQIAYFHHIPFPSSEVFRALPCRKELLEGLMGADFIGFHNHDYLRHFSSSVVRILGCESLMDDFHYGERIVKIEAHPLGVDFVNIRQACEDLRAGKKSSKILDGLDAETVLLGVDRLDYTKGLPEKLLGFREFLQNNPDQVGRVTLIQVCVPSRTEIPTYGNLRATVERLVGQINGEFGRPGYTPVHYLYRSVPQEDLMALYLAADIALVTPLRDGLNLVAKEYVSVKDDGKGVLILSELAGAASQMGEAILVNPFDVRSISAAIETAVKMPENEKVKRMTYLFERMKRYDNVAWSKRYLTGWENHTKSARLRSLKLDPQIAYQIKEKVEKSSRTFLFFDNDGTLAPIAERPELAEPTQSNLEMLRELGERPDLIVTVVTGRPRSFCEKYFTQLPINVVAEHGGFLWLQEKKRWHQDISFDEFAGLKTEVLNLFSMFCEAVPNSHIETKETCIVWHFRESEPIFAEQQAKDLIGSLHQLLHNTSYAAYSGKKSVEVRPVRSHKGHAIERVLNLYRYTLKDAVFTAGDDVTDEDMYRIHPGKNISIHVGKPNVFAKYYSEGIEELPDLCRKVFNLHEASL
jgi:trehalose 6-phosphate synthase/phosphatase